MTMGLLIGAQAGCRLLTGGGAEVRDCMRGTASGECRDARFRIPISLLYGHSNSNARSSFVLKCEVCDEKDTCSTLWTKSC